MLSENFVLHLQNNCAKLVQKQKQKQQQAIQKLDYNLKRIVSLLPDDVLKMKVGYLFQCYEGDFSKASKAYFEKKKQQQQTLKKKYYSPKKPEKKIIKKVRFQ